MDKNQGYTILKAVMLENGRVFALGEHLAAPSPYVTWACYDDEHGQRQYEWGHYGDDLTAMESDLAKRIREYQRRYQVKIVQIEAPGLYQYYALRQPLDTGALPMPPHNAPDKVVHYEQRLPVEGGAIFAWGHLTYTRPLPEKMVSRYGLHPASDNPDLTWGEYDLEQIAKAWEKARLRKLAGIGRGQTTPKKKKPDRGGR